MLYRLQSDVWSVSLEIFNKPQEHLSGKESKGRSSLPRKFPQAQEYLIAFPEVPEIKCKSAHELKPVVAGCIFNETGGLGGLSGGHRVSYSPRTALTLWSPLLGFLV